MDIGYQKKTVIEQIITMVWLSMKMEDISLPTKYQKFMKIAGSFAKRQNMTREYK